MHPTEWLHQFIVPDPPRGEAALTLSRSLVAALDHPQRHAPAVHIVGTAGKGTVAAVLTGRLVGAGVAVATHQSPHVHDVRERFMLDGRLPSWRQVESAMVAVADGIAAVVSEHGRPPTFFAVTAAMSWELGRRHDVDVFVTEAGIGGRFDATAVLDRPDTLTVITHIGLDHTDVLGATVAEIASEKAGVLAGRREAVLGGQSDPTAVAVVREFAERHGIELFEVGRLDPDWRGQGEATAQLAASRVEVVLGRPVPYADVAMPPGRFEVHETGGRRVVLDGAHNPMKLRSLAETIADGVRPGVVVAAVGRGKDLDGCAGVLASFGCPVITTEFGSSDGPRSWPASLLATAIARQGGEAEAAQGLADAADRARHATSVGDTILVTGSFLVLSEALEVLRGEAGPGVRPEP